MELLVAGKDRTSDWGAQIAVKATTLKGLRFLSSHHSALSLKESHDASEYLDRFCDLLRMRHGVNTEDFPIPTRPGLMGSAFRAIKTVLWKLLRYQHDRIAFQQNVINELVITAVNLQQAAIRERLADLEREVETLKKENQALRASRAGGQGGS
jgi:hypothetical protein